MSVGLQQFTLAVIIHNSPLLWRATSVLPSLLEASGSQIPTIHLQDLLKMASQEVVPHYHRSLFPEVPQRNLGKSRPANKRHHCQPMASCGRHHHWVLIQSHSRQKQCRQSDIIVRSNSNGPQPPKSSRHTRSAILTASPFL